MPAARPPRLLVVDDHEDTCTGLKMILERRGYDITVAYTADQATEKARRGKFRPRDQRHRFARSQRLRTNEGNAWPGRYPVSL